MASITDIMPIGVAGTTGSGMFSSSSLMGDMSGGFVGLPGTSSPVAVGSDSTFDLGNIGGGGSSGSSTSPWNILTDLSSMGASIVGNPTGVDSSIGTSTGTSNANTTENPGGTQTNNPGSPSGAGTGSAALTIWQRLASYRYDIFAVILGVIFIIIGAAQMAKSAGVSVVPA